MNSSIKIMIMIIQFFLVVADYYRHLVRHRNIKMSSNIRIHTEILRERPKIWINKNRLKTQRKLFWVNFTQPRVKYYFISVNFEHLPQWMVLKVKRYSWTTDTPNCFLLFPQTTKNNSVYVDRSNILPFTHVWVILTQNNSHCVVAYNRWLERTKHYNTIRWERHKKYSSLLIRWRCLESRKK